MSENDNKIIKLFSKGGQFNSRNSIISLSLFIFIQAKRYGHWNWMDVENAQKGMRLCDIIYVINNS